jgi:Fur family ferric uptake transcriptional regulator
MTETGPNAALTDPAPVAEEVVAALRSQGIRMTVLRRLVVEELATSTTHLSAEALLERVRRRAPDAHLATVYRNLEALLAAGVATHVHLPHGATTYHLLRSDHRSHLHVVCRHCDQVLDMPADSLDGVADRLRERHGFQLDSNHVALTGSCRACQGPQGKNDAT